MKSHKENRICTNKLTPTSGGCMGYMNLVRTNDGKEYLKCPLCGYTIDITRFKIEGN